MAWLVDLMDASQDIYNKPILGTVGCVLYAINRVALCQELAVSFCFGNGNWGDTRVTDYYCYEHQLFPLNVFLVYHG